MIGNRQMVLDVGVIIDFWLGRGSAEATAALVDHAAKGDFRLWISASSIPIIDRLAREALVQRGLPPEKAAGEVSRLMNDLFDVAGILSNHGFEQAEIYRKAKNFEDAQICAAARHLAGSPLCVVTENPSFDAIDGIPVKTPKEALMWLSDENSKTSRTIPFIDLHAQQSVLRPEIEKSIMGILNHGQYILGAEIRQLERCLAEYVGVKHAIGCSSGTDALLLALMAHGIGPGDAVFTTPFTFIATAEVISLLGAVPVFVDIDPHTYNIDPVKLDAAIRAVKTNDPSIHPLPTSNVEPRTSNLQPRTLNIEPRTLNIEHRTLNLSPRCVIAVDLYGLPADYDALKAICSHHDLFLIEDAAQSFGAEYKGKKAGSLADVGATSFFPAKPLGAYGDGGMVFTDRDDIADICRSLLVHGKGSDKYDNVRIGLNARLDTFQAAILLAKFRVFPKELESREAAAARYNRGLEAYRDILSPPLVPEGCFSAWAQYTVRARDPETRTALMGRLKKAGIPTAIYYPKPLHLQTAFAHLGYRPADFPESEAASQTVFSLPFGPYLKEDEQNIIMKSFEF